WCPEKMTYNLRTGLCIANKSEVHIHEGESFCKKLHPGAHLIDIMSEEEQLAYLPVLESFDDIWTSAIRSAGEGNNLYWPNSGKPLIYTNWHPNQPSVEANEYICLMMRKRFLYRWGDHRCRWDAGTALCEW
ncbi:hypothetical protein LSH36_1546g00017, partial [Paralvinella palmiformis]